MKIFKKKNPYWNEKMGFWKRLLWCLTYYRLTILTVLVILVTAGYIIYLNVRPSRNPILNVTMVNAITVTETDLFDRYLAEAGYDIVENCAAVSNTWQINLDGSDVRAWDYYEIVAAQLLIGEIDLFFADGQIFTSYANQHAFRDVREYMTEEELERYADYILYVTDTETGEQMPCGIIVPTGHPVGESLYYLSNCYLGIPNTYFNDEETDKVIHLILEDLP